MMRKFFIFFLLLIIAIPTAGAHVQQTHVDDYTIQLSHDPMELKPTIPTVFLINIEKDGNPVEDLEITFRISHIGSKPVIRKATSEKLYKELHVHHTFPEEGEYMAMISFNHEGRDVMAHFTIPIPEGENQLLMKEEPESMLMDHEPKNLTVGEETESMLMDHEHQHLMEEEEPERNLLREILPFVAVVLLSFFFAYKILGRITTRDYTFDTFRIPTQKKAMKSRLLLNILQATVLGVYLLLIIAGLLGTQVSSSNIATVAVFTLWWTGILIIMLLFGKVWCSVCPWHTTATWMKRHNLSLNKKWPAKLNNTYLAIGLLAGVTWFEVGLLVSHSPQYTSYLLISLLGISIGSAAIFKRRAFCMHICFIGAIQGVYSSLSPLELRSRNKGTCKTCSTKDCLKGNEKGDPCPVMVYAAAMERNNQCILCTECIKTCPYDNLTLNIRPPASELLGIKHHRIKEATFVVALLGLTFFPSATMFPAWMEFRMSIPQETFYLALTLILIGSIALPAAITYSFSWASRTLSGVKRSSVKEVFKVYAYSLIPLSLFYHLSHNLHHFIMEGTLIFNVISDPLGKGWNLFGTRDTVIMIAASETMLKNAQIGLILVGLFTSNVVAYKTSQKLFRDEKKAIKGVIPISLLLLLIALLALVFVTQPMTMMTSTTGGHGGH
jgi:ferredoxin